MNGAIRRTELFADRFEARHADRLVAGTDAGAGRSDVLGRAAWLGDVELCFGRADAGASVVDYLASWGPKAPYEGEDGRSPEGVIIKRAPIRLSFATDITNYSLKRSMRALRANEFVTPDRAPTQFPLRKGQRRRQLLPVELTSLMCFLLIYCCVNFMATAEPFFTFLHAGATQAASASVCPRLRGVRVCSTWLMRANC